MAGQSTLWHTADQIRAMEWKKAEIGLPPPVDFWAEEPSEDVKEEEFKAQKHYYVEFTIHLDPADEDSDTYSRYVRMFKNGTPEEYCAHRTIVHEVATKLGYLSYEKNQHGEILDSDNNVITEEELADIQAYQLIPLATATLGGSALNSFNQYVREYLDKSVLGIQQLAREVYAKAWEAVATTIFQYPKEAAKTQKRYLKEGGLIFCGQYKTPMTFWRRLEKMNEYLPYFPFTNADPVDYTLNIPRKLDDDELLELLDKARTNPIRKIMLQNGDSVRKYNFANDYARALEDWYDNCQLTAQLDKRERELQDRKRKPGKDPDGFSRKTKKPKKSNKKGGDGRKSPCKHCGKFHKGPDDQCWTLDKNKHNRPDGYRTPRSDRDNKKRKYADNDKQHWKKKQEEAVSRAVKKATMRIKKHYKTKYAKKKTSSRRRHALSDSDSDSEVQDNYLEGQE